MKRDILKELMDGAVSPDEAERIYDAIMDDGKMDFAEALGLSNTEATAYGYGVPFDELAKWRRDGWPNNCVACGGVIDVSRGGWIPKEHGREPHHALKHLQCPAKARPAKSK